MVPLVRSSVGWGQQIGYDQIEQLWHIEYVEELCTVSHIEPHPVSVRPHSHSFESEDLHVSGSSASPPMVLRLVLVEEALVVVLCIVVVGVSISSLTH